MVNIMPSRSRLLKSGIRPSGMTHRIHFCWPTFCCCISRPDYKRSSYFAVATTPPPNNYVFTTTVFVHLSISVLCPSSVWFTMFTQANSVFNNTLKGGSRSYGITRSSRSRITCGYAINRSYDLVAIVAIGSLPLSYLYFSRWEKITGKLTLVFVSC